jgi:hypothetical protein
MTSRLLRIEFDLRLSMHGRYKAEQKNIGLPSGMVDFEKIVNTEIEIYRIKIFFLISKSVFTESVFEICNFDFDFKSIISKFYKSI